VGTANVNAGNQVLTLGSLTLANGSGLASNYQIATSGNTGTVTAATVTLAGTKTYDSTTAFAGSAFGAIVTKINGETLTVTGAGSVASANVSAGTQTLAQGSLALANGSGLASNYQIATSGNSGTVTPATLALTGSKTFDSTTTFAASAFGTGGTISTGINGETLIVLGSGSVGGANIAGPQTLALGSLALTNGTGLAGNYQIASSGNTGTITGTTGHSVQPGNATSQFIPNVNGTTQNNNVNINFQNPSTGVPTLVHIGFTPNTPTITAANQNKNDASPAALPPGAPFTRNQGVDFLPISQYDANQYSQFKLPDYDDKDAEATLFTIIARAVAHDHAADFMIDGFWNGTASDWNGADGKNTLIGKVMYSDGAGHDVAPIDANAFPIVPGKTDFAQLLKTGPVMLGGAPGQTPAEWLLALNLAPDGKGIVCDDPITGKLAEIAYDQTTETLGSVTGIFDPKIKGFVALADAGGEIPAAAAAAVAALQGFVPSTFFAVTIH
jgi:hypothetical protein